MKPAATLSSHLRNVSRTPRTREILWVLATLVRGGNDGETLVILNLSSLKHVPQRRGPSSWRLAEEWHLFEHAAGSSSEICTLLYYRAKNQTKTHGIACQPKSFARPPAASGFPALAQQRLPEAETWQCALQVTAASVSAACSAAGSSGKLSGGTLAWRRCRPTKQGHHLLPLPASASVRAASCLASLQDVPSPGLRKLLQSSEAWPLRAQA